MMVFFIGQISGFCIDLLVKLANNLNFTYDLHFSADKQFGSLVQVTSLFTFETSKINGDY